MCEAPQTSEADRALVDFVRQTEGQIARRLREDAAFRRLVLDAKRQLDEAEVIYAVTMLTDRQDAAPPPQ